jgi:hypothetical protein
MSATRMRRARVCGLTLALLATGAWRSAGAWDAATTHSGLTGRAVAASTLHAALAQRMGRALGLFEPLRLDASVLDADSARALKARLDRLDAGGGYRPHADGVAMAEAWVRAGSVLEKTPPERGRNHFLDPRGRNGLDDAPGLSGTVQAVRLTLDDGASVRQAATGQAFDLDGMSALEWIGHPKNDLGLPALLEHWQGAVLGATPAVRDTALIQALLALGGTLAVLEDMGQPAFVRNDFRGEFLRGDDGSALEHYVAAQYGVVALPPPAATVQRPDVDSYFVAADQAGLAQRTQASFFSPGSVPDDVHVVPGESPAGLLGLVNQSLRIAAPTIPALRLQPSERTLYVQQDGGRVLAYRRSGDRIRFFLDDAVYADCARRWLPVIEGYGVGLVNHLLRVTLEVAIAADSVTVKVTGAEGGAEAGVVHVVAEDTAGVRKEIGQAPLSGTGTASWRIPSGSRLIAAVATGRDAAGAFVAAGESLIP